MEKSTIEISNQGKDIHFKAMDADGRWIELVLGASEAEQTSDVLKVAAKAARRKR